MWRNVSKKIREIADFVRGVKTAAEAAPTARDSPYQLMSTSPATPTHKPDEDYRRNDGHNRHNKPEIVDHVAKAIGPRGHLRYSCSHDLDKNRARLAGKPGVSGTPANRARPVSAPYFLAQPARSAALRP